MAGFLGSIVEFFGLYQLMLNWFASFTCEVVTVDF